MNSSKTQLSEDRTVLATMFDPELTYYADGTPLVVRLSGVDVPGTAAGMKHGRPYAFQVVRWADDTTSNVAPHVLARAAEA